MGIKIKIGDHEVSMDEAREIYTGSKALFEPNVPIAYPTYPVYPVYPDPGPTAPNPWWSIQPYKTSGVIDGITY